MHVCTALLHPCLKNTQHFTHLLAQSTPHPSEHCVYSSSQFYVSIANKKINKKPFLPLEWYCPFWSHDHLNVS
uniref:Uncharacterized protein n=1 Tax=Anguilla anguilla TaxID=7936 RepID=A0A0E9SMR9_ANGAN